MSDRDGVGVELGAQLGQRNIAYTLVYTGDGYADAEDGSFTINPNEVDDFKRLITETGPYDRVIYLWALDLPDSDSFDEEEHSGTIYPERQQCGSYGSGACPDGLVTIRGAVVGHTRCSGRATFLITAGVWHNHRYGDWGARLHWNTPPFGVD